MTSSKAKSIPPSQRPTLPPPRKARASGIRARVPAPVAAMVDVVTADVRRDPRHDD